MEINKKMYKYISVISFIIVVSLSINLMFPVLTKAEGNYIKAQTNDDSTVTIQVVIDNIYKEISKLYIVKADNLAVPKTEEELMKFESDYTANSIIEYLNDTNNEFTKPIDEPGKYYAVVILKKHSQNNADDEIYVTAMSATYTYTVNKEDGKEENNKQDNNENKTENKDVNPNKTDNNQNSNKDNTSEENKNEKNNEEQTKVEVNKKEEKKTENSAKKDIVEEVMQVTVNQKQEKDFDSDEYEELKDVNDKKEENNNNKKEEQKSAVKSEVKAEVKTEPEIKVESLIKKENIENNNNKNTNTKNNNQVKINNEKKAENKGEKVNQKSVVDETMFINKNENKSEQKLPQTGEDDSGLKIAIALFSLIGIASFVKYKSMK
ncbi:MAG: LPXTG cell wall anchor domain-containing protein [Clostridia bacterium]|nr:LPXTG cell wall anchor domain-containing protein [Clostridia bacterium]